MHLGCKGLDDKSQCLLILGLSLLFFSSFFATWTSRSIAARDHQIGMPPLDRTPRKSFDGTSEMKRGELNAQIDEHAQLVYELHECNDGSLQ